MTERNSTRQLYDTCRGVSSLCPVTATTQGYYPNKGINLFFAIGFGIAAVATFAVGMKKKTWTYMALITTGCCLELAGYVARVCLHDNPWNRDAYETQIVAIILAPTIICVSIYLTLKHVCLALNPNISRIRPRLYPFIFVPADVSCLLIQAIGGGIAASAGSSTPNLELLQNGNRTIIAGIVLQVIFLGCFGIIATEYRLRLKRWIKTPEAYPEAVALYRDRNFRLFIYAATSAYILIFIRCIYRIAEMSGGWGNHIMQDEPSFIVLEGFMVLIACLILASFPPGIFFPQMAGPRIAALQKHKKADRATKEAIGGGDDIQQDADMSGPGRGNFERVP
ncbi:RTA1 like protein-domain-containing protein [Coniochaeta sp. 2T2.1]|nr:RTA1 like protein-domain-containing protein [Coniochaeta sp. 2T2.1]